MNVKSHSLEAEETVILYRSVSNFVICSKSLYGLYLSNDPQSPGHASVVTYRASFAL